MSPLLFQSLSSVSVFCLLSLSPSPFLSLFLSLYLSLCLSVSLSLCLSVSVCVRKSVGSARVPRAQVCVFQTQNQKLQASQHLQSLSRMPAGASVATKARVPHQAKLCHKSPSGCTQLRSRPYCLCPPVRASPLIRARVLQSDITTHVETAL